MTTTPHWFGAPRAAADPALVDEFLEHKRYQGLTDSALYGYRQVLNRLIEVAPWPPYEPRHIIAAVSKESWGYRTRFTMDANNRSRPGGVPHLKELLGHMQLATTAEYVHLLSEDLADDQERANLVRQLELDFPEDGLVAVIHHQTLNPVRALHAVHLAAPEGRAAHARGAHGDAHDGRRRTA